MKLTTNRLSLTEITWDDLDEIHRLQSIFEVDEFNTVGIPKDIEETKDKINTPGPSDLKTTMILLAWQESACLMTDLKLEREKK